MLVSVYVLVWVVNSRNGACETEEPMETPVAIIAIQVPRCQTTSGNPTQNRNRARNGEPRTTFYPLAFLLTSWST
eukprot:1137582-Amphidinium_carterae.1